MTGYTVHTGTSKKFVSGWDRVFAARTEAKSGATSDKKKKSANKEKKK